MTEETAKELAAAMNRLSSSLERMSLGGLGGVGLHIYHHVIQQQYQNNNPPYYQSPLYGGLAVGCTMGRQ